MLFLSIKLRKAWLYLFCAIFLLTGTTSHGVKSIAEDQAITAYEEGYSSYRRGHFFDAEDRFIEALKLEPNLLKAHYWLGKLYNEQGRIDDAIFHWEEVERLKKLIMNRRKALSISNNEYPSYAQMLKMSQTSRKAKEIYEKAQYLLDKGHWDAAEVEARSAIELYPAKHEYVIFLARLLWDKNELQASIKFYRDLLLMRDITWKGFNEGIERMIKADMKFVAEPLMRLHKAKFSGQPGFENLDRKFVEFSEPEVSAAGKVVKRNDGQVIINIGMKHGLGLSDEYRLRMRAFKSGVPILDPENGNRIGFAPANTTGELLLTKVYQNTSWALIRKEFGPGLKAGDLIEFKKESE